MDVFLVTLAIIFIIVQIGLSKKENKYLGWIMPSFTIFLSINAAIGYLIYHKEFTLTTIGNALLVAAIYNILTVILIIIYRIMRKKITKSK